MPGLINSNMLPDNFQKDIESISIIGSVPTILDVICRTTGMGFAAVARVTESRWIACTVRDDIQFGLKPGGELKIETTICHEIRQNRKAVVIDNVAEDEIYRNHHTPAMYGFQSYISIPIILKDGTFFGTLCAIDPRPARLNNTQTIDTFKLFAELIAFHLHALEQVTSSNARLLEEQKASELREQFIAVLGHDLRNPIGAISMGAALLQKSPHLNERGKEITALISRSVTRMTDLIENVLDFARGRLGGGISLNRNADIPIEPVINHVVEELRAIYPGKVVEVYIALSSPVYCDQKRISQVISNLLGNALKYGSDKQPVRVRAENKEGRFILSIANSGDPIPASAMERLFHPFSRGEVQSDQQGLGLGLYIASQIVEAHGGKLDVVSNIEETCFTLSIPLNNDNLP